MREKSGRIISSVSDLAEIINLLTDEQKIVVFKTIKDRIPEITKTTETTETNKDISTPQKNRP